jgi:ferredoxin
MSEADVYESLATMIAAEDIVGQPVTDALLKLVSLQFTPEEAGLALKIGCQGGTLEALAEKLGMDKNGLLEKMMSMADKGTIRYDPAEKNPTYKTVAMSAGGLTETGAWGGIRYPFTIQLTKTLHQVLKEHAEEALAKLGFPYTPVWAGMCALPDDIKPEENLAEAVREAGHWSVSLCPCRVSRGLIDTENPCKHMVETCVHTGELSRWAVKHGMARSLSHDELVEHLEKTNRDGLVHTINLLGQICNCCEDCCAIFRTYKMELPTFIPSPFAARVDEDACTACGTCEDCCPVDAITVDATAKVKEERCIGCGVCVPACPTESVKLARRPESDKGDVPEEVQKAMD